MISTITHVMSTDQGNALEDYVWCAGMLRFNSNRREREEKVKVKTTSPGQSLTGIHEHCQMLRKETKLKLVYASSLYIYFFCCY